MKNLLKISMLALLLGVLTFTACEDNDTHVDADTTEETRMEEPDDIDVMPTDTVMNDTGNDMEDMDATEENIVE